MFHTSTALVFIREILPHIDLDWGSKKVRYVSNLLVSLFDKACYNHLVLLYQNASYLNQNGDR